MTRLPTDPADASEQRGEWIAGFAPVAVTTRSGRLESVHHGVAVALDRDGTAIALAGDPSIVVFPRSSNKPLQAVAMVRAGLRVPDDQLAVACASHDGTPIHLAAVERLLAGAGLSAAALGNTPAMPLNPGARDAAIIAGIGPSALQMNCSGKHAAMLATCVHNGWTLEDYLDPGHPLQRRITETIAEVVGEPISSIAIDGCGAPAHAYSLVALARGVRTIAVGIDDRPATAVTRAMREHPGLVGGERRDVTRLMRAMPGSIAKDGAEGVFVAALADGRAAAVKVADGGGRATTALLLAALRAIGVDGAELEGIPEPVLGHGRPVGTVEVLAFDRGVGVG